MRFDPRRKSTAKVLGARMAYIDSGKGDPIVLQHGNPTSSFLWRHVIPELNRSGRCVAPDLIGMGDSEKVSSGAGAYRFVEHRQYLEALLEVLGVRENVTLVAHDWGGPLLFDWGRRNPDAVRAIVFMETIVTPISETEWPEAARSIFSAMRSDAGEEIVLTKNVFVERLLPASVLNPMSEEVHNEYRRPYREPGESRRPTLTWPREIPMDGLPSDVAEIVALNQEWLENTSIPKLFINAEPGFILTGRVREVARNFPNQIEVTLPGSHFIQEDSGVEVGKAIREFLAGI